MAKRVQIFVSDFHATGVVRNALTIANHAAQQGFTVRLLVGSGEGPLRSNLLRLVEVVELMAPGGQTSSRRHMLRKIFGAYRRHSREWGADVLMSAGNHGHLVSTFAWAGLPGTKLLRISNDPDHEGVSLSLRARAWRRAKFALVTRRADRLVLISRQLERHRLLAPLVASGKARVISNGVDVAEVRRKAAEPCAHPWLQPKREMPTLLNVGRHVPQKNYARLLGALALAQRQRPLRLVIVGEGQEQAIAANRARAAELGLANRVDFVPATANPFPYMAAADAFVLPSLWEGSSNALLEAMACGTPVIASHSAGDAWHVLDQGAYGILVDPKAEAAIADAMLRQTGADPVHPGERATEFDRSHTLAAYLEVLREAAGPVAD